jgi:hypothetical protein
MRVLVACEYSGTVRDAFIALGHEAMSCDLLPTDVEGPHYQGDIFDVLDDGWDLMIAHPPCTYLSNAGARHLYPKKFLNQQRYEQGLEAKQFFMKLLTCNIKKICVENPVPSSIFGLPKYHQVIQPYEFGHPYQKKTCLWLKNLPPLMATMYVQKQESTKVVGNWFNAGGKDRQKNRAKTFEGIATAMANQWGAV